MSAIMSLVNNVVTHSIPGVNNPNYVPLSDFTVNYPTGRTTTEGTTQGVTSTFYVTANNTPLNTTLYWGIISPKTTSNSDFVSSNGTFLIDSHPGSLPAYQNTGSFTVTVKNDSLTEGTEYFTVGIGRSADSLTAVTGLITIYDTSLGTPPSPTYNLTVTSTEILEGSNTTFTAYGTNIVDGTYYWTINNITTTNSDFTESSGSVVILDNNGTFNVTANNDGITESSETFTVSLRSSNINGPILANSSSTTILDGSLPVGAQELTGGFNPDWLLITYQFVDGSDLNSLTYVGVPPYDGLAYGANTYVYIPSTANVAGTFGGNSTGTGISAWESVLVNAKAIKQYNSAASMSIDCYGYWGGTVGTQANYRIKIWEGGTPIKSGNTWTNPTCTGEYTIYSIPNSITATSLSEAQNTLNGLLGRIWIHYNDPTYGNRVIAQNTY